MGQEAKGLMAHFNFKYCTVKYFHETHEHPNIESKESPNE